ncbi:hypothetical protein [Streptomyces sp. NPDC008317]|uniref:hypothetical protein n=1 Tax=Streptomyces sp. NPDC008317 TaxID=3364827 RepID=UPI0036EBC414
MSIENPHSHRTADHLRTAHSVLTVRQLRERGVTPGVIAERCRPGGPWQQVLPQVYLLHSGPPNSAERLEAALLYAGRDPGAHGPLGGGREAMVTGLAALALHRFSSVPPLPGLPRIDVLVPRQRRLRDAGDVAIRRTNALPRPQEVAGLPCAPMPRALADAVAELDDAETVRRLLTEAVRGGHCDAGAVLEELEHARLLDRPQVAAALDALLAEGRSVAEDRLIAMVRCHALPDPVWNVDLRLPGGPPLGGVDAYWPEHAVAVEIDARTVRPGTAAGEDGHGDVYATDAYGDGDAYGPGGTYGPGGAFDQLFDRAFEHGFENAEDDAVWSRYARERERLEALGITVIHLTPAKLRDSAEQQAAIVRTALMASADRTPAAYVVVTPR